MALYFGHRKSVDFDWFGLDAITNPQDLIDQIEAASGESFSPQMVQPGTVVGKVNGVKVSFFRYAYPLLRPAESWSGCLLASLDDLAAMKLSAIYDRNTRKDFIDLHVLMKHHAPLESLLALFFEKYPEASSTHILRSLLYFGEADQEPMPAMLSRATWARIKKEILEAVSAIEIEER